MTSRFSILPGAVMLICCLGMTSSLSFSKERGDRAPSVPGLTPKEERLYLNGVADGFQVLNAALLHQGRQPLYCIPPKIVLYGRDLRELASNDSEKDRKDVDLIVSALFGLMDRYPCNP